MNQLNSDKYIFSVSELNSIIKELFDNTPFFKKLTLKGELSNYKGKNISGHLYFSLKDNESTIKCVMFKYDTFSLTSDFKDGDEVILEGSLSSYVPSGTYQFIVKKMNKEGEGDILLKKKELIERLEKEGLFDISRKKNILVYPKNIGIIVGKNSAASKDLEFNLTRRRPLSNISFYYSLVQGENASINIIKRLLEADNDNNDVLILARGGGSNEDLNAFDDEMLVRTIVSLKTPLISAIGHEINKSICDLVSDRYASTPTGAAEIAVRNKEEVLLDLKQYQSLFKKLISNKIKDDENRLLNIKTNKKLQNLESLYEGYELKLNNLKKNLDILYIKSLKEKEMNIKNLNSLIEAYNPKNILEKGFVIIKDENNKIIKESKNLLDNSINTIVFKDKEVKVRVKKEK